MFISSSDLQYSYSWNALRGDNALYRLGSDRAEVNRHEGYEVLDFINDFVKTQLNNGSKVGALKAERMLQRAPSNLRSRVHLTQWLRENWPLYS